MVKKAVIRPVTGKEAQMRLHQISDFMDKMVEEGRTPGCSIVVYRHGKQIFRHVTGVADLMTRRPLVGDEHYFIFSCTKPMTAVAGLQLLEKGRFLLSDPLAEYMPEFKTMYIKDGNGNLKKAENPILIGQLFDMTAGFHYNCDCPAIEKVRTETDGKMDTLSVVRSLAEEPLQFEPGTDWAYSLCHDVLAGLVSLLSGKPFRDYVKENILDPLGMTHTAFHPTAEMLENMPTLYQFIPTGEKIETDLVRAQMSSTMAEDGSFVDIGKSVPHVFSPEYDSGGAGLTTTVEDYGLFASALSMGGLGRTGERILSPTTVALMHRNRLSPKQRAKLFQPHLAPYGYGLGVRTMMEPEIDGALSPIGEFGWGGAAGATICADTTTETGFFFAQHTRAPREPWYQPRIRNAVYGALD